MAEVTNDQISYSTVDVWSDAQEWNWKKTHRHQSHGSQPTNQRGQRIYTIHDNKLVLQLWLKLWLKLWLASSSGEGHCRTEGKSSVATTVIITKRPLYVFFTACISGPVWYTHSHILGRSKGFETPRAIPRGIQFTSTLIERNVAQMATWWFQQIKVVHTASRRVSTPAIRYVMRVRRS